MPSRRVEMPHRDANDPGRLQVCRLVPTVHEAREFERRVNQFAWPSPCECILRHFRRRHRRSARPYTQPRDEKHAIDLTRVRELQHPSAMTIQADSSTMTTPRPPDPIAQRTIPSTMVPLCGFSSKVGPFAAMLNRPQSGPSRPRRRRPHPALRPATLRHNPRRAPGISTQ